ncbi:hypothetical protein [Photorhabdus antumapuensis]|uniref:hypothetical protein n=1 Tax=Photorhabdus antumapuensis TaxID=2862867 RepID=UPI001CED4933|nr:hypothetical protein [Photorhabdus antumapuensis]MCA6223144.1 hypothetical protein [Photorhabdus antumapuensis]
MKVKKHRSEKVIEVFAVYWIGDKTYFYGWAKGYDGLLTYNVDEVDIIEPSLSGDFIFFDNGIFYSPLISEGILDGLLEADQDSYARFLELLKTEGRID